MQRPLESGARADPALDGAQFLVIPAFGSTARSQDEAVLSRGRENGLTVVEANVGVSLIVSDGEVAAVRREQTAVTFAEIAIPAARPGNGSERRLAREGLERTNLSQRMVAPARVR